MDIAIVTGASSSLGQAISRRLIQLGFRVYGLGGDYKDCELQNVNFRPVSCDLADPVAIEAACRNILSKEKGVYLLVNNAKYFGQAPFEQIQLADMERILRINLLCPLVLMRILGETLKSLQGYLIQIGAPLSASSNGGAAGAASEGGLKWMGEMLFNEYRSSGVRVCHLSPEPNRARDARIRFRKGARPEATIDPEAIAQAVEQILQSPYGNVVTEMVIRPLRIDEPDLDPVRKIPYPDPQPIPYTIPREVVEAEEQLEEEEWKQQQQQKKKRRNRKKRVAEQTRAADDESPKSSDSARPDKAPVEQQESKPRKKSRRKPKPPRVSVGFHDKQSQDVKTDAVSSQEDKPVKKSARKSTKKAAKKASDGKTARTAKKTARKSATKSAAKQAKKKGAARKSAKKAAPRKSTKKTTKKAAKKQSGKAAAKSGTENKSD